MMIRVLLHPFLAPASPEFLMNQSSKIPLSLFALLLVVDAASGQSANPAPAFPTVRQAPPGVLEAFDVNAGTLQSLSLPSSVEKPFEVRVFLGRMLHTLELRPHDVRSDKFVLLVEDRNGIRQVPRPTSVTYRGTLRGQPDSIVAASLVDGQLRALIQLGKAVWAVQPLTQADPQAARSSHIVYAADATVLPGYRCGVPDTLLARPAARGKSSGGLTPQALKEAEIAIDADFDYYLKNGSNVTNTQNDVTSVMNNVDVIYKRDVTIQFKITTILVRTSRVYTSNSPGTLLGQFRSRWNSFHGNIKRDLAHLFTGKSRSSGVIGVAFLRVVCNLSSAYALSWARFTLNMTSRTGLVAHEIGHNFAARHCNLSSPCNIMCSGLGGCSRNLRAFAPVSINAIVAFKNSLGCLSNASKPPILFTIAPASVSSFNPAAVTVTGLNLDTVTSVTVGPGTSTSITSKNPTALTFTPPAPNLIATNPVTVTNPGGTSNPVNLSVTGNHPSVVSIPSIVVRGFSYPLAVHTDKAWMAVLMLSASNRASAVSGIVNLGIGNNFTELVQLAVLTGDSKGSGALKLMIPKTAPAFRAFWQAVTLNPSKVSFPLEVSNVSSMLIL
ncbi:MAG: M12 family metallo-peptidase [Planctomycetota bacterium]